MDAFGGVLRELRHEAQLTQEDLAGRSGLSKAYISALELGRKPAPPFAVVDVLAEALRVETNLLWVLARDERAARLRSRIEGVPASKRRGQVSPAEAESSSPAARGALGKAEKRKLAKKLRRIAQELESDTN